MLAIVAALLAAACNSLLAIKDPTLDDAGGGGIDSAIDAPMIDASMIDASMIDALMIDAPIDGPPAVCSTGVCCNTTTGQFEPATKLCATTTDFRCSGSCAGQPQQRMTQQFCSGTSSTCSGQMVPGNFTNLGSACAADQLCTPQAGAAPQCPACPFGCDTSANACRAPKLWVFTTDAIFTGAFGAASGGRVTADIKCQDKYNLSFTARGCTLANVHAVLQVDDNADTLARMSLNFPIPLAAEMFRATDATRVTDKWDTFVNPNAVLLAPVAAGTDPVVFWSGRGLSTNHQCAGTGGGWTSTASVGDTGNAITVNKWTSQGAGNCSDLIPHLMCVCW